MRAFLPLLLMLVAAFAGAQTASTPAYQTFLIFLPEVQKDMALNPAVVAKARKIQEQGQKEFMLMVQPKRNDDQARLPDLATIKKQRAKTENAIVALLTSAQKIRLRQLSLQYAGPFALTTREIQKQLGITPKQSAALLQATSAAIKEVNGAISAPGKGGGFHKLPNSRSATDFASMRGKVIKNLDAKTATILTASQRQKWQAMKGKPFPTEVFYRPLVPMGVRKPGRP